jgi:hypothetical protein
VVKKKPKNQKLEIYPVEKISHKVPVDFSQLSASSQRSYGIPHYYEDIKFQCLGCDKEVTFPASQQKQWYEEQKRYFWERPNKCFDCYREWLMLRHDIAHFYQVLRGAPTVEELQAMLDKIERCRVLSRGKVNWAVYNRVKKLFDSAQGRE